MVYLGLVGFGLFRVYLGLVSGWFWVYLEFISGWFRVGLVFLVGFHLGLL